MRSNLMVILSNEEVSTDLLAASKKAGRECDVLRLDHSEQLYQYVILELISLITQLPLRNVQEKD